MKVESAVLVMLVAAFAAASGACVVADSGGGGAGGAGNSGTGGGPACSNVAPCGGSLVGAWTVTSSCLTVTGELDLSTVGAHCQPAPVTGSLHVTGTWTANADGTYSDNTITSGAEQFTFEPSCLVISSTPVTCSGAASIIQSLGYSSLVCTSTAGGGCSCSGTVQQVGGMGLVSPAPSTSGNYTTSGNLVTITTDSADTDAS